MSHSNPFRRVIGPAVTAALLPALALGGTARAAGPPARSPAAGARVVAARLTGVSCKGNSFCMAAGSYPYKGVRLTEAWNGRSWRDVRNPLSGNLTGISCGGPAFCFATRVRSPQGQAIGSAEWNGRTWKAFNSGDLFGVTCGSPKLCMIIQEGASPHTIAGWNGKHWLAGPDACSGAPPGTDCGFTALDCGSATFCLANGYACDTTDCGDGRSPFTLIWNGSTWTWPGTDPTAVQRFADLSCSWGDFCMFIPYNRHATIATIWQSAGWQDASPNLPAVCHGAPHCWLRGPLSCGAPQDCVVIPIASPVSLIWSNFAWKAVPLARIRGTVPNLAGLSCGSSTNCMAVGSYGKPARPAAEHWNGTRWQLTRPLTR